MPIPLTLAVVLLALAGFVSEWKPVDITALSIMVLLIVLGLVSPQEGISGFSSSATITVMAMFILSFGIARTGVIISVTDWLMRWGGKSLFRQVVTMGLIVGPITALINNTAVVAVFLPTIENWCKKQGISASKLLIPLSYSTILGGTITVIGTSTNILASGLSEQLGYGAFSLFQFTPVGLITFSVGLLYLGLAAPWLLPSRKVRAGDTADDSMGDRYQLQDYVSEVVIPPESSLVGQTLRSSSLQRQFDIDVLEIIRRDEHFAQPIADKRLQTGDIMLVRSGREELLKIKQEKGIYILPDVEFGSDPLAEDLEPEEDGIAEVLILSSSSMLGSTLKELRFRQRYNATVLAIRRGQELVRERLGRVPLRFGDVLLVQGPRQSVVGLQTSRDVLVIAQRDLETLRPEKAGVAIAIGLSVVLLAAFNIFPILVSALVGVVAMVVTGCLKPGELYQAVRWDIIFLLAGLIPLGIAMDNSGATQWLSNLLVAAGGTLSGYWVLIFFYIATAILTEILSNNASVVLMLPIAVKTAETLGFNPLSFMFVVTFAASNSFMTPIGYQTNTMVYGPGGYRFLDFTRFGSPLTLIMTVLTPLLIYHFFGL
ncbi:MAG: SLC13 family permease [Cyanobacteria bacterium J06642_2]